MKSDLGTRALTALAMVAVAGVALWLGGWFWAVFVGLNGVVVKSHGSASVAGVANAVAVAARLLEDTLTERIAADLAELGEAQLRKNGATAAAK